MKKSRNIPSINAGSMADIAFLLLIFFLVSTEIYNDKGIAVTLPEYYDGPVGLMAERDVCVIRINGVGELLLEGRTIGTAEIKDAVKLFIMNPEKLDIRPVSPRNAVVSLQHDADIDYKLYVEVYSELKAAYRELYDEYASDFFGASFSELNAKDKNSVRDAIPLKISEAEYKI